ncbi:cytochrome c nitrite reductase pentaheme subunit [bacterium BMS3Bbin04]|nr:cytochrome c nitrite reductase pentaheme subunit [bacterium BMS3Bbin04]
MIDKSVQGWRVSGILILAVAIGILMLSQVAFAENACVVCHTEMTPELVESFLESDAHVGQNSCVGCHGGDASVDPEDMDAAHEVDGFTPPPWTVQQSVEQCGSCHTHEAETYKSGPHGSALAAGKGDVPGCIGCHTQHPLHRVLDENSPVRPNRVPQTCGKCHADQPMMAAHDLPDDVVRLYRNSVHGVALLDRDNQGAPSCTGCHDNHGTHNENVADFDEACARCHSFEAAAFKTSKHQRIWDLTDVPVCITCHGNHDIGRAGVHMIGTKEPAVCSKCHNAGDPPEEVFQLLNSLEEEFARGQAVLVQAQEAGRQVNNEFMALKAVYDQLLEARKAVHYFDIAKIKAEVDKGLSLSREVMGSVENLLTESSCVACHTEMDEDITHAFANDVHADSEISCHGCHGGNPLIEGEDAMSRSEGFIGVPSRSGDVGAFCARCHSDPEYMHRFNPAISTDQYAQFQISGHGQTLDRNPRDENVANCIKCHGVHDIRTVSDPLSPVYPLNVPETCNNCHGKSEMMNQYGITINPYEQYKTSVHGEALLAKGDISAPACNDCHGNHGTLPPEINSVANVCGQCHALNASLFRESIHRGIWELRGMPECGSCHGSHAIHHPTDEMLSAKEGSFCSTCHEEGGPPDQVYTMLDSLEQHIDLAENRLMLAESFLVSVDEGYFKLDKARTELTKMRVLLHNFDLDTLNASYAKTMSIIHEVYDIGEEGIANAKYRRKGFWIAFVIFAAFNIIVILKIRDLNRKRKNE